MALQGLMEAGWPECDLSDTEIATIPGTPLKLHFQRGQPHAILQAFLRDLNEFIEPANNSRGYSDEGSSTENNSVYTSNHKAATAFDYNWSDHPVNFMAPDPRAGWNGSVLIAGDQTPAVRELLAWYEGMVYWGNDWSSFRDSMHFQIGYNTYGAKNFDRVHSFIQRKIRADGFSVFRRGGVPRGGGTAVQPQQPANPIQPTSGLTGRVLWELADKPPRMPLERYEELLPLVEEMFDRIQANTIDRRAMVLSQLYPESGALYYKREIHDGSDYEGRCRDLGNCQPGDGRKFRGRGWIQLTGRAHTTGFSTWMHRQGLAPYETYFVDRPEEIESDRNAMLTVVYYLTVSRPQFMSLADARNIEAATKAVNGGLTHLDERKRVYNRALAINANLLSRTDEWEALMATEVQSWSIYATPGEPKIPAINLLAAIDAKIHRDLTDEDARAGDVSAIQRVARTAAGQGANRSAGAIAHATRVLNEIYATNPAYIIAATPGKA